LEWVDWFNQRRLLEPIDYLPPAEFEAAFQRQEDPATPFDSSNQASDEPGAVHGSKGVGVADAAIELSQAPQLGAQ
jgi:hypothetical protein